MFYSKVKPKSSYNHMVASTFVTKNRQH